MVLYPPQTSLGVILVQLEDGLIRALLHRENLLEKIVPLPASMVHQIRMSKMQTIHVCTLMWDLPKLHHHSGSTPSHQHTYIQLLILHTSATDVAISSVNISSWTKMTHEQGSLWRNHVDGDAVLSRKCSLCNSASKVLLHTNLGRQHH